MKIYVGQLMNKVEKMTVEVFCGGLYTKPTSIRYYGGKLYDTKRSDRVLRRSCEDPNLARLRNLNYKREHNFCSGISSSAKPCLVTGRLTYLQDTKVGIGLSIPIRQENIGKCLFGPLNLSDGLDSCSQL